MKLLGLSGGSTKGVGILGAVEGLYSNGYTPDIIVGTSVGALLSVPLALGVYDKTVIDRARAKFLNVSLKDFFTNPPIKDTGKWSINALINLFLSKIAVGNLDKLKETLSGIVNEDDFELYKLLVSQGRLAKCFAVTVDYVSGETLVIPLHSLNYEDYLSVVQASCSIPVFNEYVSYRGKLLYDGGLRDHVGTHLIIDLGYPIEEAITIFTRPKKHIISSEKPSNVIEVLEGTIAIMNNEISKLDEFMIDTYCSKRRILNKKIYLPSVLTSLYDTNKERLLKLYNIGYFIGKDLK